MIPSICCVPGAWRHSWNGGVCLFTPSIRIIFAVLYPEKSRVAIHTRSDTYSSHSSLFLVYEPVLPLLQSGGSRYHPLLLVATQQQHVCYDYCLPLPKHRRERAWHKVHHDERPDKHDPKRINDGVIDELSVSNIPLPFLSDPTPSHSAPPL